MSGVQALPGGGAGTGPHTDRARLAAARGHVACLPSQGEPQPLAAIYQLVSQACESAIQSECPASR